jgi:hypothetical protein
MIQHLPTLLLREWIQHKRGWLIAIFLPPLLFLALLPFGEMNGMPDDKLPVVAFAIMLISGAVLYAISLLVALFQLPGLARRDVQDRSIEFWLSLPGGHGESIAAIFLAHAVLVPLAAMLIGMGFGLPIAAAVMTKQSGLAAAASVPWVSVVVAALPVVLRVALGSVLVMLWLAPAVLVLMAASAWLKRLGVPAVLLVVVFGTLLARKVYEITWPTDALTSLNHHVNHSLVTQPDQLMEQLHGTGLSNIWQWAGQDAVQGLAQLASPDFVIAAAVAAAAFALLIVKRARGG